MYNSENLKQFFAWYPIAWQEEIFESKCFSYLQPFLSWTLLTSTIDNFLSYGYRMVEVALILYCVLWQTIKEAVI